MNIYWYAPKGIFSAFSDPLDNPSFRLRCWNIHQKLRENGYTSFIIHDLKELKDPDILVLMSFGEEEYQIAKWMKENNKKVLHDYCENIRGIEILEKTKKLCDCLVCCSTELARLESNHYKTVVIRDMIEEPPSIKMHDSDPNILKVVWSGMGGNAQLPSGVLKPIIESVAKMQYLEISDRKESHIRYNRNTWFSDMLTADICICPQVHWLCAAKSNVKVTAAMSLGLPVIASPIKSYQEVIVNGENGFIANTLEDWGNYLKELRAKERRSIISINALKCLAPYRIDNIYSQWLELFKS